MELKEQRADYYWHNSDDLVRAREFKWNEKKGKKSSGLNLCRFWVLPRERQRTKRKGAQSITESAWVWRLVLCIYKPGTKQTTLDLMLLMFLALIGLVIEARWHLSVTWVEAKLHQNHLRLFAVMQIGISLKADTQTYLYLLTDLNQFGHLVLQLAVSLHEVGQVVLQCLLSGGRRQADRQWAFKAERIQGKSRALCVRLIYALICIMRLFHFIRPIMALFYSYSQLHQEMADLKDILITQWD